MSATQAAPPHRVVVVGGGFGGLSAVRALRRAAVDVTLVDRRNFHLFQPLLYQVATGALSPGEIASPLRGILKRQRNATVLLGEVEGFDLGARKVLLGRQANGESSGELPYDTLVVAAGASTPTSATTTGPSTRRGSRRSRTRWPSGAGSSSPSRRPRSRTTPSAGGRG